MLKFNKLKQYLLLIVSVVTFNGVRAGDISEGFGKTPKQEATDAFIAYCEKLVDESIIGTKDLDYVCEHKQLVNPLATADVYASFVHSIHNKQLGQMVERFKEILDTGIIHDWARGKKAELEDRRKTEEKVHEDTRELHRPMRFVPIQSGQYTSHIDGSIIEIKPGIEIQETPVTQYQWSQVMGSNPSYCTQGFGGEEIMIEEEKVAMLSDNPVENVSYRDIQKFIQKLNEQQDGYEYSLPSVDEYESVLQAALGASWLAELEEKIALARTSDVASGSYFEQGKDRMWSLLGNVWEFTRDCRKGDEEGYAHIVFGTSYATRSTLSTFERLLRPVLYGQSRDRSIGFRLVRRLQANTRQVNVFESKVYSKNQVDWEEDIVDEDSRWMVEQLGNFILKDDELQLMYVNKSLYPKETQHTLDALIEVCSSFDIEATVDCLKRKTVLSLKDHQVVDVSPLSQLTNLEGLLLNINKIVDVNALSELTNLEQLLLDHNQVVDVSALSQLKNLKRLWLDNNQIVGVSWLSQLTKLDRLQLNNNQIVDVRALFRLTNLEWLVLDNNQIVDVSPLFQLTNLSELRLNNNQVVDVSGLSQLTKLQRLHLDNNQIVNVSALSKLTKLQRLHLDNNQVVDVSGLSQLTNLKYLYLKNNQIVDVSMLSKLKLTTLEYLCLENNQIVDVSPLLKLTNLRRLEIQGNPIKDFSVVEELRKRGVYVEV